MKTLLLCSGGADSSTLLYKLYNEGADKIHCVFVHLVRIIEMHVKSF